MKRICVTAAVVLAVLLVATGASGSPPLNPGFETGDFTDWNGDSSGAGTWVINDGSTLPFSHFGAPKPAEGHFDAVFDQGEEATGVLYRDVVVPSSGTVAFSFAYRNYSDAWEMDGNPYDLDGDNQWISIDVLEGGADPSSFDPADIITTVFRPTGSDALSSGWRNEVVHLNGLEGQTVRLRFATADTEYYETLFVDAPFTPAVAGGDERSPEKIAYCSVAGNTWPDGTPIRVQTFITLQFGQVDLDPHYKGAVVANYVKGMGLTCDQIPIGYTLQGKTNVENAPETHADIYPYYAPAPTP